MTPRLLLRVAFSGALAALAASPAWAATITTLSVDFESPSYALGGVDGQDGWIGLNAPAVSDAQAHSGTQSLRTGGLNASRAQHLLDPANPLGTFDIANATDWWVQAWVRIDSGGAGAGLFLVNTLGGCPLIQVSGAGAPLFHGCTTQNVPPTLGASVLDQWVLFQMVHTAAMGQGVSMSITGANVNLQVTLTQYTGPGTALPTHLHLEGDAYWDDVRAGYGPAPAVPEPALVVLLATAGVAVRLARRRPRP